MDCVIKMLIDHDIDIYNIEKCIKKINRLMIFGFILISIDIYMLKTNITSLEQELCKKKYKKHTLDDFYKNAKKSEDNKQKGE